MHGMLSAIHCATYGIKEADAAPCKRFGNHHAYNRMIPSKGHYCSLNQVLWECFFGAYRQVAEFQLHLHVDCMLRQPVPCSTLALCNLLYNAAQ